MFRCASIGETDIWKPVQIILQYRRFLQLRQESTQVTGDIGMFCPDTCVHIPFFTERPGVTDITSPHHFIVGEFVGKRVILYKNAGSFVKNQKSIVRAYFT